MIKKTVLEELDSKITLVLEKYEALKEENRLLKISIESNKETEAQLRQEILKLREEEELKELELEDIAQRINQAIGKSEELQQISA